jgi:hypothetical protein
MQAFAGDLALPVYKLGEGCIGYQIGRQLQGQSVSRRCNAGHATSLRAIQRASKHRNKKTCRLRKETVPPFNPQIRHDAPYEYCKKPILCLNPAKKAFKALAVRQFLHLKTPEGRK